MIHIRFVSVSALSLFWSFLSISNDHCLICTCSWLSSAAVLASGVWGAWDPIYALSRNGGERGRCHGDETEREPSEVQFRFPAARCTLPLCEWSAGALHNAPIKSGTKIVHNNFNRNNVSVTSFIVKWCSTVIALLFFYHSPDSVNCSNKKNMYFCV